jgi:two-component system, sensor histidine kinase PdtaS
VRPSILLFTVTLLSISSIGNNTIDSLLTELDKNKEDTVKVRLLFSISEQYFSLGNETKSILFIEDAIGLAENLGDNKLSASIRKDGARLYSKIGNSSKAIKELDKLLSYYQTENDSENLAQTFSYLAAIYDLQGNHAVALENYYQALEINEQLLNTKNIIKNSGNIGKVYMFQQQYSDATKFFFKSLSLSKQIEFLEGMANCYNNLGILNYYQENMDSAMFYFFQSEILKTNLNDSIGLSSLYNNLGEIYFLKDSYDKALEYQEKAKSIQYSVNDKEGLVYSYINIGAVYEKQGLYNDAIDAHRQALAIAKSLQANWLIMEAYFFIHNDYKSKGNFNEALLYFTKYHHLRDSLTSYESKEKIARLQLKYDSGQKDIQIKALEQINVEQLEITEQISTNQMLLIVLSIFLLAIIILMIRQTSLRKSNNFLLEKMLKQKEVLLKEVHHRVKNNFQLISSLLNLQAGNVTDEKIKMALVKNKNRIESMALVHKSLYENDDLVHVDLNKYVHQLVTNVQSSFNLENKNIKVVVEIEDILVESEQATPLGLIINELITNAYKYAFTGKKGGLLKISIMNCNERDYCLKVQDNGIGLPSSFDIDKIESLGMELVRLLSEQIDGTLEICKEGGATFTITFPKD